ncbi:acyl carrier protein [Streptomyces sp. NPDC059568]|uniref:acyl carrier protein n=1 Tax=Streptomyces sp. NPDC059568 TaxID=3346868 RepID=UPI003698784A
MDGIQDVLGAVVGVLRAEGHLADGQVGALETPLSEGGADLTSLDLVRVLVILEDRLGIELEDSAIMNAHFATVGDLVDVVSRSVRGVRAAAAVGGEPGDDSP